MFTGGGEIAQKSMPVYVIKNRRGGGGRSFCLCSHQSVAPYRYNQLNLSSSCLWQYCMIEHVTPYVVHVRKRKCVRHQQPPRKLLQWRWFAICLDSTPASRIPISWLIFTFCLFAASLWKLNTLTIRYMSPCGPANDITKCRQGGWCEGNSSFYVIF